MELPMGNQVQETARAEIIRIVAVYSLFGGLWIYLSDTLLGLVIQDPVLISRISMYKGLMFITLTAVLLYVLIARYIKRITNYLNERNQAQHQLAQQKALLDIVIEGTTDAVYIKGADGRYLMANSAVARFVNKPVEEVIGSDDLHLFPPDDARALMAKDQWVMAQDEPQTYEERVMTPNGELYFLSTKGTMHAEDGTVCGLFGIARDITDRVRVEKALDERNRLLDTLLANLPVGVFMVAAPSGTPLIANRKAQELLGRGILPAVNKENLSEVYEAYKFGTMQRYPVDEMPIVRGMQGESISIDDLLVVRPDGTAKQLEIFGAPVLDAAGQPWASLVCFQDISGRKEQEHEKLKIEKLESLGVLAGGIAHDFNNILTGIMGNISFAQRFLDTGHKALMPLREAEQASLRARELSQQLMTFAKGGEQINKEISIQKLVDESVSLVLRGSNVKGIVSADDSIQSIEADEGQIEQVFHNIVLNAAQAMPGGGSLNITTQNVLISTANGLKLQPGPYVTISFADEGCGISDDELKKIFDPYFTTKSAGTGLGLASVHSIISRHGGAIDASSTVGHGTTFTIYLPSTGRLPASHCDADAGQSVGAHAGGSILVMDDEEIIRTLTAEILEYLGYQVMACCDGAEAVKLYEAAWKSGDPFSAVIMDLTIPGGMGGKEAALQILTIDPQACLIVSSGYSNDPIMADYHTYGFSGAVAKPYTMSEFGQILIPLLAGNDKSMENSIA
jgi:PAS domain S-box-containing protein